MSEALHGVRAAESGLRPETERGPALAAWPDRGATSSWLLWVLPAALPGPRRADPAIAARNYVAFSADTSWSGPMVSQILVKSLSK